MSLSHSFSLRLFSSSPTRLPPLHFSLRNPLGSIPSSPVNAEHSSPESNCSSFGGTKQLTSEETLVNESNQTDGLTVMNDDDSDPGSSDEYFLTISNEMAHSCTMGKDDKLIDSNSNKFLGPEHTPLTPKKLDGCHVKKESVTSCTANRKEYARLNNGFVVEIPDSILNCKSHPSVPYGDLLRVVLSKALTYLADLQDIMRGEIALRFPLSPFDTRPAYMRYVRWGGLMLKELEIRTSACCLPPISNHAWKKALAIASATSESPDIRISFHPQELGLDYDQYGGEHPRDILTRSLIMLAEHPKTRGILRQIAQEFAADQYDCDKPHSTTSQERNLDERDVVDAGIAVTKGKIPRPYEIQKRMQVLGDLRRLIQKLAGKLEECAKGVGCVQLGSSELSKTIGHSISSSAGSMDNLWNITMQVTALQTNVGPVNYTTSYFSTSPSEEKNLSWDSNVAETEDSIFGPDLAIDVPPHIGWGRMPDGKNLNYHLVNSDDVEKPDRSSYHPRRHTMSWSDTFV